MSITVSDILRENFPDVKFAIVGDSPFASCCTDYVSAKHILAQGIIQIGHSCSTESPVPVLLLPEPMNPNFQDLITNISTLPNKIIIILGHDNEEVKSQTLRILTESGKDIVETREEAQGILYVGNGYSIPCLIEKADQDVWTLTNQNLVHHSAYSFISIRFHYISMVQESTIFGLIILSLPYYNSIASKIKTLARNNKKEIYPIYLGKITPLKLGNFSDIDMFVLVGCPHTPLPDNRDFFKPVITPYEFEVGLNQNWDGKYSTKFDGDYEAILTPLTSTENAERFQRRTFKGLTPEVEGIKEIEEGYKGIAMQYESEIREAK